AAVGALPRGDRLSARDLRKAARADRAGAMSEADLIARIRELFPRAGDDAAIVGDQVITNDMLIEDVDFKRDVPLRLIARKSLAVNLSDLAAMGAKPQYALMAIGAPEWVDTAALLDESATAAR